MTTKTIAEQAQVMLDSLKPGARLFLTEWPISPSGKKRRYLLDGVPSQFNWMAYDYEVELPKYDPPYPPIPDGFELYTGPESPRYGDLCRSKCSTDDSPWIEYGSLNSLYALNGKIRSEYFIARPIAKPQPRKPQIPDVPVFWVRYKAASEGVAMLVTRVLPQGFSIIASPGHNVNVPSQFFREYQWSADRKTWNEF